MTLGGNAAIRLSPAALSLAALERSFESLPPEKRAEVEWSVKPIHDALSSLIDEPLTDEIVTRAAVILLESTFALLRILDPSVEATLSLHAERVRANQRRIEEVSSDPVIRDELALICSVVAALGRIVERDRGSWTPLDEAPPPVVEDVLLHPAASFIRLTALWAAIAFALDHGAPHERVIELIDLAFVEAVRVEELMRAAGEPIEIEPEEPAARGDRILRNAAAAREALDESDLRVLDEARLRTLR